MAPAERDPALTVVRYRQAVRAPGAETKRAEASARFAWGSGTTNRLRGPRGRGPLNPTAKRLESIGFLRQVFDPLWLLDTLKARR